MPANNITTGRRMVGVEEGDRLARFQPEDDPSQTVARQGGQDDGAQDEAGADLFGDVRKHRATITHSVDGWANRGIRRIRARHPKIESGYSYSRRRLGFDTCTAPNAVQGEYSMEVHRLLNHHPGRLAIACMGVIKHLFQLIKGGMEDWGDTCPTRGIDIRYYRCFGRTYEFN